MNEDGRRGTSTLRDEWSMVADVRMSDVMGSEEFLSYARQAGSRSPDRIESAEELGWTQRAGVLARLAEVRTQSQRTIAAALEGMGTASADLRAASARYSLARQMAEMAEMKCSSIRALDDRPAGLPYDSHTRAIGRAGYFVALALCVMGELVIARASFSALGLSSSLTAGLVVTVAATVALAGSIVGKLLRRRHEAPDPRELSHERVKIGVLIAQIVLVVFAMPLVRAVHGDFGVFESLVLAAVGGALLVSAITASYLHANSRLDALDTTDRALLRAWRAATVHDRELLRAKARYMDALNQMRAEAAAVVGRLELARMEAASELARVEASLDEPTWIAQLRGWAEGENLPFEVGDLLPLGDRRYP